MASPGKNYPERKDVLDKARQVFERQRKDDISDTTGWGLIAGAPGGSGGAIDADYFRATYGGGNGPDADFNSSHDTAHMLASFGGATVEDSGGFTLSDHPSAQNWDGASVGPALWTNHRVDVPVSGLWSILFEFTVWPNFFEANRVLDPVYAEIQCYPEGVQDIVWLMDNTDNFGGTPGTGLSGSCNFTLNIDHGTPIWFEVRLWGRDTSNVHWAAQPMAVQIDGCTIWREKPGSGGGGGGAGPLTWDAIDTSTDGGGHLSPYATSPPEFAIDSNFVYLRGAVEYTSGYSPTGDGIVIPGGAPTTMRQLPGILVDEAVGTIREISSPQVSVSGADGALFIPYFQGGVTRTTFGIFWLDGLSYPIA